MLFPLPFVPQLSYKTGGRRFGAPRANGRQHAACDLIAPLGTEIYAVMDGVVQRPSRPFYRGTNSLEIRHQNGLVLRYCEILPNSSVGLGPGVAVKEGQVIAKVGKMFVDSMLHLEVYGGTESGALTVRSNPPFQRRGDLIDPTRLLDQWAMLPKKKETVGAAP